MTTAGTLFVLCVKAIQRGDLIVRASVQDKEFSFQNWFIRRLDESGLNWDQGGRNSYPDFTLVAHTEGFELKGLAYPGREVTFDSNSQPPRGRHNGREVYYVFGRYPKKPDGTSYPVLDLVICHGSFLNADHEYEHENKNVPGFGSYGDIQIRDRKMYVVPTPFHLVTGLAHQLTLITPASETAPHPELVEVGQLQRTECADLVVAYTFDLKTNDLTGVRVPNPGAGTVHHFRAWRVKGAPVMPVAMNKVDPASLEVDAKSDDNA